ncbi:MAG: helix-turn-helix domain-containing protein [Clostridium sp.]|nr:helix-turn-helix domain-containing protein [Clostridium sp.]
MIDLKKRISEAEIIKELNISRKEIKFYRQNKFITPLLDENNQMYYTLSDIVILRYVRMYEDLGYDEKEIIKKIKGKTQFQIFEDILRSVKGKAEYNLDISLQAKLRLDKVLERVYKTGSIRIEYIDELSKFIDKKEKSNNLNLFIHELLLIIVFMMIVTLVFCILTEKFYMLFIIGVLGLLVLIRYKYYKKRK